jgi:nicotinamidase-related amidase
MMRVSLWGWWTFAAVIALALAPAAPARADVFDEWNTLTIPSPPPLKAVTVDPKTTALLMLDFMPTNCGNSPRCMATLPKVRTLLDGARTTHTLVVYSEFPGAAASAVLAPVAPLANEPSVQASADKFIGTSLDQILKDHGITTVIVVGAAANGAVLHTGSDAAQRGYKVVVPVDGMSGNSPFDEAYTALQLTNGPPSGANVTLTRTAMVTF